VTGLLLALLAAYGVHLVYTSVGFGWTGVAPGPSAPRRRGRLQDRLVDAGLGDVGLRELAAVTALLALLGVAGGWIVFGGLLAPLASGLLVGTAPILGARSRRARRRAAAREAWPRLVEEVRIKATTLGRSLPQALLDAGDHAPDDLRPAFEAARREWLLSTDFEATLAVLKERLADATADAVCETLLVAHQIGGNEIDRCLRALHDDRVLDLQGRKDADARQAGARFARWFTLVVPLGMAMVGLSIGDGRAAYGTAWGQLLVLAALVLMATCWAWAGQIMRLPPDERVFT
jgi:tight adherence protein B